MAEEQTGHYGCGNVAVADKVTQNEVKQTPKRCSSTSPGSTLPHKSPRTYDVQSPSKQTADAGEGHSEMNTEGPTSPPNCPTARRKSWRRSTLTRRTLSALPNPYQILCRSISTSLSQQERLEKLMDASMRLAIERTQNMLQSVPNSSMESFQKQVEHMQKEWGCLAKSIRSEPRSHQLPASAVSSSDPAVQRAMEKIQEAINRLQAEGESWEALLNKHRSKAEELERKVEEGQKRCVSLDSTSVAQSSQYQFIQNKPDYHGLLNRQQPMLQNMEIIMGTQCEMVRELLSIKEQSQLMVKETSGQLAAEAGFQAVSADVIRNLMAAPISSATT